MENPNGIPVRYLALFREWAHRANENGFDRFELADGIYDILYELRARGEHAGAAFLGLWTQMSREQVCSHDHC
jgi:hypothetical protein